MTALTLISLIIGIVEPILAGFGVIPTQYQPLATGILKAIAAIKTDLTGSNGQLSVNAATILQSIVSGIQVLQAQGALPTEAAGLVVALTSASAAGLAAVEGITKVDPTALQPITPIA